MRRIDAGIFCGALLIAPALVSGQEDLVGDRPDFTESALSIAPGRVQLEAGFGYGEDEGVSTEEIGQVLARVGLFENVELRLGLGSWVRAEEADGWDGGSLGFKVHLLDNWGARPALAILAGASTPYGDEEVADDDWQPEVKLAAGWELTETLELSVNAGYARPGAGEERFDQAQWSASLGWGATDRLGAFVELFGFDQEVKGGGSTQYLDGGVTWLLTPDLQLDLYGGRGLTDEATDWFAGTGLVVRW
jgi:hypothetical protein